MLLLNLQDRIHIENEYKLKIVYKLLCGEGDLDMIKELSNSNEKKNQSTDPLKSQNQKKIS